MSTHASQESHSTPSHKQHFLFVKKKQENKFTFLCIILQMMVNFILAIQWHILCHDSSDFRIHVCLYMIINT